MVNYQRNRLQFIATCSAFLIVHWGMLANFQSFATDRYHQYFSKILVLLDSTKLPAQNLKKWTNHFKNETIILSNEFICRKGHYYHFSQMVRLFGPVPVARGLLPLAAARPNWLPAALLLLLLPVLFLAVRVWAALAGCRTTPPRRTSRRLSAEL